MIMLVLVRGDMAHDGFLSVWGDLVYCEFWSMQFWFMPRFATTTPPHRYPTSFSSLTIPTDWIWFTDALHSLTTYTCSLVL